MSDIIYLDNSATTRMCDEALSTYNTVSRDCFANPSSLHGLGFLAESEIKKARETILSTLSAKDCEIVFCASGSEANNLAIFGRALSKERYRGWGKIISTLGEHASVSEPLEKLSELGFEVAYIPTRGGRLDMQALEKELTKNVVLVSMMMVNNETGALYDIKSAAALIKARCPEAAIHVDCTQSYLKLPFTKLNTGADMLTLSSHKIEGPKGVGALVIDKKIIKSRGLAPIVLGGGQEGGLRSGTENVAGIAAFAAAAKIGFEERAQRTEKMRNLREYLIKRISECLSLADIYITLPERCAPHILNITVPNIKSETMLHFLSSRGIYVSSGSACSSNKKHGSGALIAFGHSAEMADCSLRISLSYRNEKWELDRLVEALISGYESLARIKKCQR